MLDFWEWYQSKSNEQVQVRLRSKDKLKDNHTWGPKYTTDNAILRQYYEEKAGVAFDPVESTITDDMLDTMLDVWDEHEG